jgi:hypothetical protein
LIVQASKGYKPDEITFKKQIASTYISQGSGKVI